MRDGQLLFVSMCDKIILQCHGIKNDLIMIHPGFFEGFILAIYFARLPSTGMEANLVIVVGVNGEDLLALISDGTIDVCQKSGEAYHSIDNVAASEG